MKKKRISDTVKPKLRAGVKVVVTGRSILKLSPPGKHVGIVTQVARWPGIKRYCVVVRLDEDRRFHHYAFWPHQVEKVKKKKKVTPRVRKHV